MRVEARRHNTFVVLLRRLLLLRLLFLVFLCHRLIWYRRDGMCNSYTRCWWVRERTSEKERERGGD
jgi:hypothetical protein